MTLKTLTFVKDKKVQRKFLQIKRLKKQQLAAYISALTALKLMLIRF